MKGFGEGLTDRHINRLADQLPLSLCTQVRIVGETESDSLKW